MKTKTFDYDALGPEDRGHLLRLKETIYKNNCRSTVLVAEIGGALLAAKDRLEHGQFTTFCRLETDLSARTVEHYMNVAALADRVGPEIDRLPVSVAYLLAAPSTPDHLVSTVMSAVGRGEPVRVKWVKKLLGTKREHVEPTSGGGFGVAINLVVNALTLHDAETVHEILTSEPAQAAKSFWVELCDGLGKKIADEAAPAAKPNLPGHMPAGDAPALASEAGMERAAAGIEQQAQAVLDKDLERSLPVHG